MKSKTIAITKIFVWILLLLSQYGNVYSQASTSYKLNCIGSVTSDSVQVSAIILPSTAYLHGFISEKDKASFINCKIVDNKISEIFISPLLAPIANSASLISIFKKEHNFFKLKVTYFYKNKRSTKIINIPWEQISITEINNKGLKSFQLNFGEIKL